MPRPLGPPELGRSIAPVKRSMGGMDGFSRVEPEPNEPVFYEAWEARVLAMNHAMGATGSWSIAMRRASRANNYRRAS